MFSFYFFVFSKKNITFVAATLWHWNIQLLKQNRVLTEVDGAN